LDYRQLINNWHLKASEEDYFSKFVFEYLAFIAYLKTVKYIPANPSNTYSDRTVIQKLKQDETIKTSYLTKVDEDMRLNVIWQELKCALDRKPLGNVSRTPNQVEEIQYWNCSHAELNQKTTEEKTLPSGVLRSSNDWENMVEFWYSIRNNLFHGAKDPESDRDQMAVRTGYIKLSALVETFLE
jgi:hypothetical protein